MDGETIVLEQDTSAVFGAFQPIVVWCGSDARTFLTLWQTATLPNIIFLPPLGANPSGLLVAVDGLFQLNPFPANVSPFTGLASLYIQTVPRPFAFDSVFSSVCAIATKRKVEINGAQIQNSIVPRSYAMADSSVAYSALPSQLLPFASRQWGTTLWPGSHVAHQTHLVYSRPVQMRQFAVQPFQFLGRASGTLTPGAPVTIGIAALQNGPTAGPQFFLPPGAPRPEVVFWTDLIVSGATNTMNWTVAVGYVYQPLSTNGMNFAPNTQYTEYVLVAANSNSSVITTPSYPASTYGKLPTCVYLASNQMVEYAVPTSPAALVGIVITVGGNYSNYDVTWPGPTNFAVHVEWDSMVFIDTVATAYGSPFANASSGTDLAGMVADTTNVAVTRGMSAAGNQVMRQIKRVRPHEE